MDIAREEYIFKSFFFNFEGSEFSWHRLGSCSVYQTKLNVMASRFTCPCTISPYPNSEWHEFSWLSTDYDIKNSCHASKLPALSWISCPNCCSVAGSCLQNCMSVAKLYIYFIKKSMTTMTTEMNFLWAEMNTEMKKITYIHDTFYFHLFFRDKIRKKEKKMGLTRGWLVTQSWLGSFRSQTWFAETLADNLLFFCYDSNAAEKCM